MAAFAGSDRVVVYRAQRAARDARRSPADPGPGRSRRLPLLITVLLFWLTLAGQLTAAVAAPPPPPLIAVILPRDNARFETIHSAFLAGIANLTTVVGKPRLYVQSPNPDIMSLRNSVRKATALGADLIVVYGTRAATAARQEDFTEPLIFADVFDPVAMGLVPSLQRGGNLVTGVCGYAPVQTLLKAFEQTFGPGRLGVVIEAKFPASTIQSQVLHSSLCRHVTSAGAPEQGGRGTHPCALEAVTSTLQGQAAMAEALKKLDGKIDVLYLSDLVPSDRLADEILTLAGRAGLPVISQRFGAADRGALISLEADPVEQGEMLAEIARRIIDGDLPEDLPPMIPRRISLVVNLATARQFGIDIPFAVLSQTTRIVR